jgi:hypothetical protein
MSNILSSKVGYKRDTDPGYMMHIESLENSYRVRHYQDLYWLNIYGGYALISIVACSFVLYKNRKK